MSDDVKNLIEKLEECGIDLKSPPRQINSWDDVEKKIEDMSYSWEKLSEEEKAAKKEQDAINFLKTQEELGDPGIDLEKLEENIFLKFNQDLDEVGIDLRELDLALAPISNLDIKKTLEEKRKEIANSINSEDGIDIDAFENLREEEQKIKNKLQSEALEKLEKQKAERIETFKKITEEQNWAAKNLEDCTSEELNEKENRELEQKIQDEETKKRFQEILNLEIKYDHAKLDKMIYDTYKTKMKDFE